MARIKKQQRRENRGEWVKSTNRSQRWKRSALRDKVPWERALIGVRDADSSVARARGKRLVHWLVDQESELVREVHLVRALASVPWPALRRDRLPDVVVSSPGALVRLLVEKYPLPPVLQQSFTSDPSNRRDFVALASHVGGGGGFREARDNGLLPAGTTRRVYNAFMAGPCIRPVGRAWRVAQAQSVGLPVELGLRVYDRARWLWWGERGDSYWLGAFRWLAKQRVEPPVMMVLVEYLCRAHVELAGRTAASVLRMAEAWALEHRRGYGGSTALTAPPASSPAYEGVPLPGLGERDDGWSVQQIVHPLRLWQEGQHMQHCVWSYSAALRSGRCTIWSLSHRGVPTLTLEIVKRRIVQVRGHRNRSAYPHERLVLDEWQQALVRPFYGVRKEVPNARMRA